ncbi:membrane dipeptidase [Allosphingosinicella indica]|uniref:Membrane dipeptidase n=2 Tax=Allosphingosinicella indica TaxID=941907 RepID=A0A1X7FYM2_9SPHN|nr:membrane dipeptidase [Allosphingosinicella indica]
MRERAQDLIERSFVWDNHACMPLRYGDETFLPELARAKESGFSAVTLNLGFGDQAPEEHLRMAAWFRRWLRQHNRDFMLVTSAQELDKARRTGRVAVLFDIEGAVAIGDQLSLIEMYRDLGVTWMLLVYNRSNSVGSGCMDEHDGGLTAFGREVVAEMNRVGMTLCLSHTGERTAREALDASARPMIFSHSNCGAVFPHPRNISDDMIKACAARGGVVGINGLGNFLGEDGAPLVPAILRHIDHAVQLVGPRHVGLGLDYVYDQEELREYLRSKPELFPGGLPDSLPFVAPEALPDIVEGMLALGYSDDDVALVLGGNWLRVLGGNWTATHPD